MKVLLLLFCQFVSALSHKSLSYTTRSSSPQSSTDSIRFFIASEKLRGGHTDDNEEHEEDIMVKRCPCVLCGQEIIASSQADCEAHMAVCPAFARVHPENGETNPEGVYPPKEEEEEKKDIESMSVKELRTLILKSGLSDKDCIEKADLKARAKEALDLTTQD